MKTQFGTRRSVSSLAAFALAALLTASAAYAKVTVAPGYYADLVLKSTPSTGVSFTVTKSGEVKRLALDCGAATPALEQIIENSEAPISSCTGQPSS